VTRADYIAAIHLIEGLSSDVWERRFAEALGKCDPSGRFASVMYGEGGWNRYAVYWPCRVCLIGYNATDEAKRIAGELGLTIQ
jgi:hypothetical protein